MAQGSKNIFLVIAVIGAGIVILVLAFGRKDEPGQGVVLQEVFKQEPLAQAHGEAKDPVTSPAIVTSPQDGQEAGFAVQVYSFQDGDRAQKALSNLKGAGYKAFMEMSDLGEKGIWYRIRIGGLETQAQAKAMLDEVRKNYKSGFIVKPSK